MLIVIDRWYILHQLTNLSEMDVKYIRGINFKAILRQKCRMYHFNDKKYGSENKL